MTHPFDTETFEARRDRIIAQADELEWAWRRQRAEAEADTEPRRLSLVEDDEPTAALKRPRALPPLPDCLLPAKDLERP